MKKFVKRFLTIFGALIALVGFTALFVVATVLILAMGNSEWWRLPLAGIVVLGGASLLATICCMGDDDV